MLRGKQLCSESSSSRLYLEWFNLLSSDWQKHFVYMYFSISRNLPASFVKAKKCKILSSTFLGGVAYARE